MAATSRNNAVLMMKNS